MTKMFKEEINSVCVHMSLFSKLQKSERDAQLELLQQKLSAARQQHRILHNTIIELQGNIRVFVRVRPFLPHERSSKAIDENGLLRVSTDDACVSIIDGNMDPSRSYSFDKAFDCDATQEHLFEHTKPLITSLLDGYNVCIMAYGQTGSGKTYTMQGTPDNPGIISRVLDLLFVKMAKNQNIIKYSVELSMVEIYNESIYDLLSDEGIGVKQRLLSTSIAGIGLSTISVIGRNDLGTSIAAGTANRAEAATLINAHSSRSHCIVALTITSIPLSKSASATRSKLYLVDLAGSENIEMTGVTGDNLLEASYINKSLAALGDVLGALAENRRHIPYRNSRLTHFLQESLGGGAKMLLVVTVSPCLIYLRETMHALSFGVRARQVIRGAATKKKINLTQGLTTLQPLQSQGFTKSKSSPQITSHTKKQAVNPKSTFTPRRITQKMK